MNPLSILFILLTLLPVSGFSHVSHTLEVITSSEVVIKSRLSKDNNQVYIDITMPATQDVGFEIYDSEGKVKHLWNEQELHEGRHQLKLTLPELTMGKYLLHVKVGEKVYKQLVVL